MAVEAQAPPQLERSWLVLRGLLALWCVGLALLVAVEAAGDGPGGTRWSVDQLYADAGAGRVSSPVVVDHDRDVVLWRVGDEQRTAPLDGRSPSDVTRLAQEADPALTSEVRFGQGWFVEVAGQQLSGPASVYVSVGALAGLWLLVAGPQPWRATRWSWFWLAAVPGGPVAFLLLSGPTPGVRPPRPERPRLTGGKALLLAIGLSILLDPLAGLAVQALSAL